MLPICLRHVPYPYAPFEVTIRTIMGIRLLKASEEVRFLFSGALEEVWSGTLGDAEPRGPRRPPPHAGVRQALRC